MKVKGKGFQMMNSATFNAYLDMLGISHKAAAEECAVDRQTMKRWCTGEYDVPHGVEKWILRRLMEHDAYVQDICDKARVAVNDEDVAFIAYPRYADPRVGGGAAAVEAMKERSWVMAAVTEAMGRLRAEGYTVMLDYNTLSDGSRIDSAWRRDKPVEGGCLAVRCPKARYDGNYFWTCTETGEDVGPDKLACHIGLGEPEPQRNMYDRYVINEEGVYIGDDLLIKAVIDGEIEKPRWMPEEDIEAYRRGVRKNVGAETEPSEEGDDDR